ncbi:MAG TPA: bifunctional aspartate transaminase/aspartate 4-decarboxylase [Candidatus Angelobacter sp.]|nr:bifunctional aspartate transaminase/aspartate 4-decarboxylase [Candidatus Angelobacter sp.]
MPLQDMSKTKALSPFELKDVLINLAVTGHDRLMLNAGRGNPNFLATIPRHGFWQLGHFAMREAERSFAYMPEGVGGFPKKEGLEARFELFARENNEVPGVEFLASCVSYIRDQMGLNAGAFLYEMCEAILGCNYPVPGRMLELSEKIVAQYLRREMAGGHPLRGNFDVFATEGGTAAMTYIFNTMRENHLIKKGDSIALGLPIFTPYIEIPHLNDYQLVEVKVNAEATQHWQYSAKELDKLLNPEVKAFFLVNPSNPPSVRMNDKGIEQLVKIVKKRPDLIILTDDVYGTFADNFVSLFARCPHNTILVYSFSKYFGATGWRLGAIAIHEENILDQKLQALPRNAQETLKQRYSSISTEPGKLKFIDRMVADSRTVALNHTAGLSTPQQVQMVLFSLFSLMDTHEDYKSAMKRLIRHRQEALYRAIGVTPERGPNDVNYYTLLDLETLGARVYGEPFVRWMMKTIDPSEILFRLAKESGVVLLPGRGFGTPHPSARVSLANLNEADYVQIGQTVRKLMDEYYTRFSATKRKAA